MSKVGGILRTLGLYWMIINDALLIGVLFWKGNPWWGWFFSYVTLGVIMWELAGMLLKRKTISTMFKEWIQKVGIWGYIALFLFSNAMFGLVLHLAVW